MVALGVYFSQQKPKGCAAKDAALVAAGQKLYRGGDAATGVPACAACHAPDGAGVPKNYPRLAGQYADYTYAQLKAFKARRARRRQGRQGRQRQDHGDDRRQDDRRADEGGRRIHVRPALKLRRATASRVRVAAGGRARLFAASALQRASASRQSGSAKPNVALELRRRQHAVGGPPRRQSDSRRS